MSLTSTLILTLIKPLEQEEEVNTERIMAYGGSKH